MRPYISRATCSNCGECLTICPYEVFADDNGTIMVMAPEECIECGACMEQCKEKAVYFDD